MVTKAMGLLFTHGSRGDVTRSGGFGEGVVIIRFSRCRLFEYSGAKKLYKVWAQNDGENSGDVASLEGAKILETRGRGSDMMSARGWSPLPYMVVSPFPRSGLPPSSTSVQLSCLRCRIQTLPHILDPRRDRRCWSVTRWELCSI
jgi:hypothetical protein